VTLGIELVYRLYSGVASGCTHVESWRRSLFIWELNELVLIRMLKDAASLLYSTPGFLSLGDLTE
jgi:hypothetical protein